MDKKTKILVIIIILGLFGLMGMGAFYFGKKQQPTVSPSPLASVFPEPSIEPSLMPTPRPTLQPSPSPSPSPTPSPSLSPSPSPQADLYISEYSFNHPPKQGEAFTIRIGLYNKGNAQAGGFWWEWWATTSAPSYACRQRIDSLAAHGGQIVYCTYTYGGWANYETKAVVDKDNEVAESDESNNSYVQNVVPIH